MVKMIGMTNIVVNITRKAVRIPSHSLLLTLFFILLRLCIFHIPSKIILCHEKDSDNHNHKQAHDNRCR